MVLHRDDVGVVGRVARLARLAAALGPISAPAAGQLLDLAHRELLVDRALRERFGVVAPDQRARMTHVEPPGLDDGRAPLRGSWSSRCRLATWLRDLPTMRRDLGLAAGPRARPSALVGARFLDRIEILALDVLDQRQRHHVALVEIAN